VGQDLLIIKASRSHSDTTHSVGLLCASDQPDVGTLPASTQKSQETDIQAPGVIRNRNTKKRAAADHALDRANTRVGQWVSYYVIIISINLNLFLDKEHNRVKAAKTVKAYKEQEIQLQIRTDVNCKLHVSAALARREYTASHQTWHWINPKSGANA
jgi:hypothetical protein